MRRPIYIPKQVKEAIGDHFEVAVQRAVEGYLSANEDEDTLTGHLGGQLRISDQKIMVTEVEVGGEWTWSVDYYKLRGRGGNATEKILGADGIFVLQMVRGERSELKSLLFQAKNNWTTDTSLVKQCIKLSTWREAAFVLNYTPNKFEAITLDNVLLSRGRKTAQVPVRLLSEFLSNDFLNCIVGDTDLVYEAQERRLVWRTVDGEVVATRFALPHEIRVAITPPGRYVNARIDKEIANDEIHSYRMEASEEEMLSLKPKYTDKDLKATKKQLAFAYHPDHYNSMKDLYKQILNRRMQEFNNAFAYIHDNKKNKR